MRSFRPLYLLPIAVVVAAVVLLLLRLTDRPQAAHTQDAVAGAQGMDDVCCPPLPEYEQVSDVPPPDIPTGSGLPCIVALGARDCCEECLEMRIMLEDMRPDLEGIADVVVVDTGLYPQEAQRWRLRLTPTQIIVDAEGTEIARLEGAMTREQIINALREAGIGVE